MQRHEHDGEGGVRGSDEGRRGFVGQVAWRQPENHGRLDENRRDSLEKFFVRSGRGRVLMEAERMTKYAESRSEGALLIGD